MEQIIKNHVNSDGSGSQASYSTGMWTCLAAMLLLFFGMLIVLFTCFSTRKKRRNGTTVYKTEYVNNGAHGNGVAAPRRKKRFGIF